MDRSDLKRGLPGHIATGVTILIASFWTLWGMGEMYLEGRVVSAAGTEAQLISSGAVE